MRKLSFALAALLALAFAGGAAAQTYHQPWRPLTFRPGLQVMAVAAGGGGGGYVGPGDVVSGAKVWVGLRAYSAAAAAAQAKAVKLVRTNGDTCDLLVALTGDLGNTANCSAGSGQNNISPATWCAATTCQIERFYDQAGSGFDFVSSASRATLVLNCIGSRSCADFGAGLSWYDGATPDTAQPFTTSVVAIRTGAFSAQNDLFVLGNGTFYLTANTIGGFFGTTQTVAASDNVWHAAQIVASGSSSAIAVDATQTAGLNMGINSTGPNFWLGSQNSGGTNPLNGKLTEIGLWPVAFTGTQQTSVCHNQFTYWGTPTSC